ncbi:MAG: UDP-2,3-diacylglucosamine diphosphatase, partial [Rikenellaceae bacterium]
TTPHIFDIGGKKVYIAHGDNLDIKKSKVVQFMNSGFRSKWIRAIFSTLVHPDWALKFGQWWSHSSRKGHKDNIDRIHKYRDAIIEYSTQLQATTPCDTYIYGHLHLLSKHTIAGGTEVIFINDWSNNPHYATMSEEGDIKIEKV